MTTGYKCLALLSLICCTCTPDPVPFYQIPETVKPYVVFPKGSYWIYEEVADQRIDSVYLYRVETIPENNAVGKLGYKFEELILGYTRSLRKDSVRGYGSPLFGDVSKWSLDEYVLSGPSPAITTTFVYPMSIGQTAQITGEDEIIYESYHESMKVNGQVYNEVLVFALNLVGDPDPISRIYYAKDVGVIKKELADGSVWELKKYFID